MAIKGAHPEGVCINKFMRDLFRLFVFKPDQDEAFLMDAPRGNTKKWTTYRGRQIIIGDWMICIGNCNPQENVLG